MADDDASFIDAQLAKTSAAIASKAGTKKTRAAKTQDAAPTRTSTRRKEKQVKISFYRFSFTDNRV